MKRTLVDHNLKRIISSCFPNMDIEKQVQPASIDIPIGDEAIHVSEGFIPIGDKSVGQIAGKKELDRIDLRNGATLHQNQTYLVRCLDVDLPKDFLGRVSPKSSIGRIDLLVRSVVDGVRAYDTIPTGTKGELWLEISPQSFNVRVEAGMPVSQIRLLTEADDATLKKYGFTDTIPPDNKIPFLIDGSGNPYAGEQLNGGIALSLNVPRSGLIGYEAITTNSIVDMRRKNNEPLLFFREQSGNFLPDKKEKITFEAGKFYIVATKELFNVPSGLSVEMDPFTFQLGELRVHYAGFFDPGFGQGGGAVGVLEIRAYKNKTVYDGQPICTVNAYPNLGVPDAMYGLAGNNYALQKGPKLAKFFSDPFGKVSRVEVKGFVPGGRGGRHRF